LGRWESKLRRLRTEFGDFDVEMGCLSVKLAVLKGRFSGQFGLFSPSRHAFGVERPEIVVYIRGSNGWLDLGSLLSGLACGAGFSDRFRPEFGENRPKSGENGAKNGVSIY
jgi:hypothetical protein